MGKDASSPSKVSPGDPKDPKASGALDAKAEPQRCLIIVMEVRVCPARL